MLETLGLIFLIVVVVFFLVFDVACWVLLKDLPSVKGGGRAGEYTGPRPDDPDFREVVRQRLEELDDM